MWIDLNTLVTCMGLLSIGLIIYFVVDSLSNDSEIENIKIEIENIKDKLNQL